MSMLRMGVRRVFECAVAATAHTLIAARTAMPPKSKQASAGTPALSLFRNWLETLETGSLLEIGTRRVPEKPSTLRRHWAPKLHYVACDFQAGEDVDVVADAERLASFFPHNSFDAVIACSAFEHIRRPWIAAEQIAYVLKPGGRVFVQTHNCFPIHAFPFDYWRFTREAMETLFCGDNGYVNQVSWYEYPAAIINAQEPLTACQAAFLNVNIIAEKA